MLGLQIPMRRKFKINSPRVREENTRESLVGFLSVIDRDGLFSRGRGRGRDGKIVPGPGPGLKLNFGPDRGRGRDWTIFAGAGAGMPGFDRPKFCCRDCAGI